MPSNPDVCRMNFRLLILLAFVTFSACKSAKPLEPSKKGSELSLTVLTYNIRYDNPKDGPDLWELRKEALAQTVSSYKPAIMGFQEVLLPQLQFLESQFKGYQRVGVGRDDGKEKGEFSPVFFDTERFDLVQNGTFWLSNTPETPSRGWDAALPRIASLAVLRDKKTRDSLWVINTHFDHVGTVARLHSAELITKLLSKALKNGKKVIFMGDLNAQPSEAPIRFLQEKLEDACPEKLAKRGTFNGFALKEDPNKPFKRIDYIWLSPDNWKVKSYDVPQPKWNGRQVSDHFPVVVTLE